VKFICLRDTFFSRLDRLFKEGEVVSFPFDPTEPKPVLDENGESVLDEEDKPVYKAENRHFKHMPGEEPVEEVVQAIDYRSLKKPELVELAVQAGIENPEENTAKELAIMLESLDETPEQ